ncbi:hypothetical protein PVK06_026716 [Gossypium arboreum]|uniref:Uncharacterized protein n=1 Tax=Gossypium arboreum TaxID=29729 RepID=A0ABR0NYD2_GOSAR|nr:hypothetical protein PVK06_026716 [Gossypium arboreum]
METLTAAKEEAEAVLWLLPDRNHKAHESQDQEKNNPGTDEVVPVQSTIVQAPMVNDHCFDKDFTTPSTQ